jgi:hypothetical protein
LTSELIFAGSITLLIYSAAAVKILE